MGFSTLNCTNSNMGNSKIPLIVSVIICIGCVILCRPYHNYTKTTEYQFNLVNIVQISYESQSYLYSLMKPKNFYELLFLPSTNSERTPRSCLFYLALLTILRSSDCQMNPGPRQVKFPCQICNRAVKWKQEALACDNCDGWYHVECMKMPSAV